jgi:hypothetical membrane protein
MVRRNTRGKSLALAGIAGPLLFVATTALCTALQPGYSGITGLVSELGAHGAAHVALMNYGGFIPLGVLIMVFGAGLVAALPNHRLLTLSAIFIVFFGIGLVLSGLVSCDAGCPRPSLGGSLGNFLHDKIAPMSFMCLISAVGLLGVYFRAVMRWRFLANYSLATAVLALLLLVLLATSLESRNLAGVWQRLMLTALFLWCSIIAMCAYRSDVPRREWLPRLVHRGLRYS